MEIANDLVRDIFSGKYGPGDQLPTERTLSERYGVAHLTLRQALAVLQRRGIIVKKRSSGAYVSSEGALVERELRPFSGGGRAVHVLGLHFGVRGRVNPANWPIRLNVYQGIVEAAFFLGVPVRLKDLLPGHDSPARIVEETGDCGGVILYDEAIPAESVRRLEEAGIPTVGINLPWEDSPSVSVNVDTVQGARLAVGHLLELGHRRIGFIGGLQTDPFMRKRYLGFRQAYDEIEQPIDERLLIFNTGGFPADGAESVERLMNCAEPPTAVFAASDYRAFGVMQKLAEMGIRVPADVSVVGFDNISESAHTQPALTTINNPLHRSGLEAMKRVYRRIREPDAGLDSLTLPTSLVIRDSTAPLSGNDAR
jgi:LacI family transcriptional regulator